MQPLHNPVLDRINPRMLDAEPLQRCKLGDCRGACCVFGVWVDLREVRDIMQHAALILPHMPDSARVPGEWFAAVEDEDKFSPSGRVIHTAVETRPDHYGGTACIFCLEDGKCALQVAAVANELHPWRFKPYYCIIHPLDLDENGRITLDQTEEMIYDEGSCVRPAPDAIPLVDTFEAELRYLLGEKGYQALQEIAAKRRNVFE